jgi:hypothetical protein
LRLRKKEREKMTIESRLEKLEAESGDGFETEAERLFRESLAGMTDVQLKEARAKAEADCREAGIPEDQPPPSMTRAEWADLRRAMLLADAAEARANGITLTDVVKQVAIERGEDPK